MVNSELVVLGSTFEQNLAMQGGVLFAIQSTLAQIKECELSYNMADDGGIIYSMSNKIQDVDSLQTVYNYTDDSPVQSLRLDKSVIKENWSR